ncbi:TetR/AcrR family transcriptional regulator [Sinomonas sp. JGH33]|uniref:TetR/AcrR family transcriptional regulator n=1 Tax=Sinomonas terricola TaxID=3110330 RepID=A0ABU5TBY0_9MICC|nr:TetR/AcrR family transcriptional regulator [Sinomonas sp. JGH33]MEA5457202.1 TetR/AcrR family transcriptional regulator [Sinomonas sp. JGH33]
MPKVSEEHREAMRRRIQDAALACVGRKGFAAASMADIVAEAGLSAGAVYVYYRGKDQLTVDVGRRVLEERLAMLEVLGETRPVPPPHEVIPEIMAGLPKTEFFPGIALQVWGEAVHSGELADVARGIIADVTGRIAAYLEAWFESSRGLAGGAAQAEAERLAPAVVGLVQGYIVQFAFAGGDVEKRYLDSARALLEGL